MNHWHEKFGDSVDVPPAGPLSKAEIQDLLGMPTKGDKVNIMAKQYLATYLNLLLRPDPDGSCANKAIFVDGIGIVEWEHLKNSAQSWLRLNGWDGTRHSGQKDWEPAVSVEGATGDVDGEALKDALDAFNNNQYDHLDCNCGGSEEAADSERQNNQDRSNSDDEFANSDQNAGNSDVEDSDHEGDGSQDDDHQSEGDDSGNGNQVGKDDDSEHGNQASKDDPGNGNQASKDDDSGNGNQAGKGGESGKGNMNGKQRRERKRR